MIDVVLAALVPQPEDRLPGLAPNSQFRRPEPRTRSGRLHGNALRGHRQNGPATGQTRPGSLLLHFLCPPHPSSCPNTGQAPEEDSQGTALGKDGRPQHAAGGSGPCLLSCSPRSFLPSACLLCFPAAACCGGLAAQRTQVLEPQTLPDPEKRLGNNSSIPGLSSQNQLLDCPPWKLTQEQPKPANVC